MTSWRIQVDKWKTYDKPKDFQTRQFSTWSKDKFLSSSTGKLNCRMDRTKESVKLQAARRNRGIDKVLTEDKDHFKTITGARLKLEKMLLCRVLRRTTAVEGLRQLQLQLMTMRTTQIHTKDEHAVKWSDNILTAFPLKGIWDLFLLWPDRQRQRRRRITK